MRVSRRAEYAVKAVLDLALHAPSKRGARSSEVARRTLVPERFLEGILRDLREAGFVSSKRGPDGGHWLAQDPSRITVGAILEAIDGPISTLPSKHRGRITPEEACVLALWAKAEAAVVGVLGAVTFDDLIRQVGAHETLDFTI